MNLQKYNNTDLFIKQLIHYGPLFHKPFDYDPDLNVFINNQKIKLTNILQEQLLNFTLFITQKKIDFPNNIKNDQKLFVQNFYESSFLKENNISYQQFLNLDLQQYIAYIQDKKYIQQYIQDETSKYQCIIDGKSYSISNLRIPFGIYQGKPGSKLTGMYRKEIQPKDVVVNSSKPIFIKQYNQEWKKQINDPQSMFLASWYDDISNKIQYMRPERSNVSVLQNNQYKFDFANLVGKNIEKILEKLFEYKDSEDIIDNQLFCCIYIIYLFGIRLGTHDLDNNVIGASQLKKENIQLINQEKGIYQIRLNFIGKDFVNYDQKRQIDYDIYQVYEKIYKSKQKKDDFFDFQSNLLNDVLEDIFPGLTAKVFRTYRSCQIMSDYCNYIIKQYKNQQIKDPQLFIAILNKGLIKVAEFCNHIKKINMTPQQKKQKKDELKQKIQELYEKIKNAKNDNLKIQIFQQKIDHLLLKLDQIDKQYQISIGTSRQNYIDPRIILKYCDNFDIPYDKIYSKQELKQIKWAISLNYLKK